MCGRYSYFGPLDILKKSFAIESLDEEPRPNYNVAPTQLVPAVLKEQAQIRLRHLHWGLIPFWAKDPKIGSRMINARAETVAEKPSFRDAFKRRRCLIPANGYYEWTGPRGSRQPYFITTPTDEPFGFAGLWETWTDRDGDTTIESCTIITTDASPGIAHIHDRMPVILIPDLYENWLDPGLRDLNELLGILEAGRVEEFTYHPVSREVNSTGNNSSDLIRPIVGNEMS